MNFREFDSRIRALSIKQRLKFLPHFFLEVLWITSLCSIPSVVIVFIVVLLNVGFNIKLPVFPIIAVLTISAVIIVSLVLLKSIPSEGLVKILEDFEKNS